MAKLEPYVRSDKNVAFVAAFIEDWKAGKLDDFDDDAYIVDSGLTLRKIVEEYLATGKYFDID